MATPPTEILLYAWASRKPDDPEISPDHTWVTDYDSRINAYADLGAVKRAQKHYWYCSGNTDPEFEITGTLLGCAPALLERAVSLIEPNQEWATGTIYEYFRDGTCHQMANQVLAATAYGWARRLKFPEPIPDYDDLLQPPPPLLMEPLTVHKAHRYWPSVWGFGVYGLQREDWLKRLRACLKMNFDD